MIYPHNFSLITSFNVSGFLTALQLTQDVLLKSLSACSPDDFGHENEILHHLRVTKRAINHCRMIMNSEVDNVTPISAKANLQ